MGRKVVVVSLGVVRVVASPAHPLPGPFAVSFTAVVAVAVQLRRALVVLVMLGEVVLLLLLLLVEVVVVGGGVASGLGLTVPAEAMGRGDGLSAAEGPSPSAVGLTAPGGRGHRVLDAVAPVAAGAGDGTGGPAPGPRGRAGGRVALVEGLSWDPAQRHVTEAQTHALRVEGLDLMSLTLQ